MTSLGEAADENSGTYHFVHLQPEHLAQLPPEEQLQACLEFRSLLLTMMGILYTPDISLSTRVVATDLIYTMAQEIAMGKVSSGNAPITYDVKQVGERLGLRPAEVRRAYETLEQLGGYCQLIRSKEAYCRVKKRKERREQPGVEDVEKLANQFSSGDFIPSLKSAL